MNYVYAVGMQSSNMFSKRRELLRGAARMYFLVHFVTRIVSVQFKQNRPRLMIAPKHHKRLKAAIKHGTTNLPITPKFNSIENYAVIYNKPHSQAMPARDKAQ